MRTVIYFTISLISLMPITVINSRLEWHDSQRILQILIITLSTAGMSIISKRLSPNNYFHLAIYAILLIGITSSICSDLPHWGLVEISLFAGTLAIAISFSKLPKHIIINFEPLLYAALLSCAVVIIRFLTFYSSALTQQELDFLPHEMIDGFSNRRFFGQVATLLIPVLLSVHFFGSGSAPKRFEPVIWILVCLVWLAVIATGTRGTWLALGVSGVLIFWVGGKVGRFLALSLLGTAAVGVALTYVMFTVIPSHSGAEVIGHPVERLTTSLSGREILWEMSWEMIRENPWLGVGPMHFAAAHNPVAAHPHNALLQLAAEWGIPATTLISLIVVYGFWRLFRTIRAHAHEINQVNSLRIAIFAALTGAAVQSMVDGVIVMPTTMVWAAILIGWVWGLEPSTDNNDYGIGNSSPHVHISPPYNLTSRFILILPFAAASCILLYTAVRDVPKIIEIETSGVVNGAMAEPLLPRFWIRGFIGSGQD
jgi:O-antigen ligase